MGRFRKPIGAAVIAVMIAAGAGAIVAPRVTSGGGGGASCNFTATTATFAARVTSAVAASGDQTICMAAGNYSEWAGANKTNGILTVKPDTGVARSAVDMPLDFSGDSGGAVHNVTVDGIQTSFDMSSNATSVLLIRDEFPRWSHFQVDGMTASQNLRIDDGDFTQADCPTDIKICAPGSGEGTLTFRVLSGGNQNYDAIKITNSRWTNQHVCGDGIDTFGGDIGATIGPGNEFANKILTDPSCGGVHSDTLQIEGGYVKFIGNYCHDSEVCVAEYAGNPRQNIVQSNVFVNIPPGGNGSGGACAAVCQDGSTNLDVSHNTLINAEIQADSDNQAARPTVNVHAYNNITQRNPSIIGTLDHNLCLTGTCTGTGSLNGTPTWVGGLTPTTYAGFALTSGSLGKAAASDGTDIGVNP